MGLFNILTANVACPICAESARFDNIQFRYGHTRQIRFGIGDTLIWNGNNVGQPGRSCLFVPGIGGPCPHCQTTYVYFIIKIVHDKIEEVTPTADDPGDDLAN